MFDEGMSSMNYLFKSVLLHKVWLLYQNSKVDTRYKIALFWLATEFVDGEIKNKPQTAK